MADKERARMKLEDAVWSAREAGMSDDEIIEEVKLALEEE